jgi:hypothetical protein
VDPRSIEQGNFETNPRIFPNQLFHSFPRPQQRLRFGWAKSRRQPQKTMGSDITQPDTPKFREARPLFPFGCPPSVHHHIMPSSLERRRLPLAKVGPNIRVADEPVIWSYRRKGGRLPPPKPHPKHQQQQSHHPKRWSHFTRRRRFPVFIPTPGENTHTPFFAMDEGKREAKANNKFQPDSQRHTPQK